MNLIKYYQFHIVSLTVSHCSVSFAEQIVAIGSLLPDAEKMEKHLSKQPKEKQ